MFPDSDYQDEEFPPDLYVMRLQGPWGLACVDAAGMPIATSEVRLPYRIPLPSTGACALIRLSRRFHRPTNLDREEQVVVLLPPHCRATRIACNGVSRDDVRRLADRPVVRVSEVLGTSNELELLIAAHDDATRSTFESPVLLGIMPDWDGSWWKSLPALT